MQPVDHDEMLLTNEAGLYLYSDFNEVSLWAQASECYQCDVLKWEPENYQSLFYKFYTQFEWILELRNCSDNELITRFRDPVTFEEYDIYRWIYSDYENSVQLVGKQAFDPCMQILVIVIALLVICSLSVMLFLRWTSLRIFFRSIILTGKTENAVVSFLKSRGIAESARRWEEGYKRNERGVWCEEMEAEEKRHRNAQRAKKYRIRKKLEFAELKAFIQSCPDTSTMSDEEIILKYNEVRKIEAPMKREPNSQRAKKYRIRKQLESAELKAFIQSCPDRSTMSDEEIILKYNEMRKIEAQMKRRRTKAEQESKELNEFIQSCPGSSAMTDEEKLLKYNEMKAENKKQKNVERCKQYCLQKKKTLHSAGKRPLSVDPTQESKQPAAKRFALEGNIFELCSFDGVDQSIAGVSNPVQKECHTRAKSLDVFRGLTICSMIFVDYGGGEYWFFKHSPWNGLTFADLIFPWFSWVMGMSTFLKVQSELRNNTSRLSLISKMAFRSCILVCLGIIVVNSKHNDLRTFRIPGVLQRLGLAYFIVGLLETQFSRVHSDLKVKELTLFSHLQDCWKQWIIISVIGVAHTALTFFLPVPYCPTGYLGPGGRYNHSAHVNCTGGAAAYIDQLFFTQNHLYKRTSCQKLYDCPISHDPEGLLGLLTNILCVYLGVHAGRILRIYRQLGQRLMRWLVLSTISISSALVLCGFSVNEGMIPLNKNLWSLSYVLMCSGLAFLVFSLLYVVIDEMKWWGGSPFYQTGRNALLLYIGHIQCRGRIPWQWNVTEPTFHSEYVIKDLWGTLLWILVAVVLYKRKIFIVV